MFETTETQKMVADMTGRLFADQNEFDVRHRRLAGAVPDRLALWPSIVEQGIVGVGTCELHGGFREQASDIAPVMAAAGEWLVVEPILAAFLCLHVLEASQDMADVADDMTAILTGEAVFAFAHQESDNPFAKPSVKARLVDGGLRVSGVKPVVRHGDLADRFIVSASLEDEIVFCRLLASADGITRNTLRLMDGASGAELELTDVDAVRLGGGEAIVASAVCLALAALCAEASGICAAANKKTFQYLAERKQFGAPLASFQALQHRVADMHVCAEEMRCMTADLFNRMQADNAGLVPSAQLAKAHIDDCGRRIGYDSVQLHGGMGVSDEYVISHYMRRLAVMRQEFGTAGSHRAARRVAGGKT